MLVQAEKAITDRSQTTATPKPPKKLEEWKLAIVDEVGDADIYTAKLGRRFWIAVADGEKKPAVAIYKDGKLTVIKGGYIAKAFAELMYWAFYRELNVKLELLSAEPMDDATEDEEAEDNAWSDHE